MENIITNKKVFFIALAAALVMGGFFTADSALAAATINSAKVNGSGNVTVAAGAIINATLNVSLTSPSVWKSTAYRFGDGSWTCVDTPDHAADTTSTETFLITAPPKKGTSDVNFEIYANNDCTNGLNMAVASASLSTTVMNILSLGTGKIWLSIVLLALVVIFLASVIFYVIKRIIDKKNETDTHINDKE